MVILDTSIIIDHLRQASAISILRKITNKQPKEEFALSIISVQELYSGQSTKNESKEKNLLATIAPFRILSYTNDVAIIAGKIIRDSTKIITFSDAAIAATAIYYKCDLATLNFKDFRDITNLELLNI